MDKLTQEEQQLIMDFYFRCGDTSDIEAGRDLVAAAPQAAKLYAGLEKALTDLDHMKHEPCPDNLVDLTIARLKLMASSSQTSNSRLHHLLDQEKKAPSVSINHPASQSSHSSSHSKSRILRPLFEVLAAAASIALVAGILFPSFGLARSKYYQVACQNNMRTLGAGFASFVNDADNGSNNLEETRVKPGSPWWKIGEQGRQAQSNTRYPFMLVKADYVDGKAFVCKGDKAADPFAIQAATINNLHDFPSHKNISYSFSLFCDKEKNPLLCARKIIASDMNPVFQKVRCDKTVAQGADEFAMLQLNEDLKKSLSPSHGGKGQNLLHGDGSVTYTRSRIVNGDDIFTLEGVDSYIGREVPKVDNDTFLVP